MATQAHLEATVSPNVSGSAAMQDFPVSIRNLSNAGINLLVDLDHHGMLRMFEDLLITLKLPRRDAAYTIACNVRSRAEVDGRMVYGCEYDWSATMDPLGVIEDLLEYLLEAAPTR